jgi:hypothetical protein
MVSKKLALYHYSVGEGEERHVIVTKHEIDQGQKVSAIFGSGCSRRPFSVAD